MILIESGLGYLVYSFWTRDIVGGFFPSLSVEHYYETGVSKRIKCPTSSRSSWLPAHICLREMDSHKKARWGCATQNIHSMLNVKIITFSLLRNNENVLWLNHS